MPSTAEVAAATGYSVQQVRDLEELGGLEPAPRGANGYRHFDERHVRDLRTYRDLASAVGPVAARRVLREVRELSAAEAAALLCGLHADLARARGQALEARDALAAIRAEPSSEGPADSMTVGELAEALGVRASTLRFWEAEGLVHPDRAGRARRYPVAAVREARIVVALRAAGYRIPAVRRALAAVREVGPALDARLDDLAARMLALLRAGTALAQLAAGDAQTGSTPSTTSAS